MFWGIAMVVAAIVLACFHARTRPSDLYAFERFIMAFIIYLCIGGTAGLVYVIADPPQPPAVVACRLRRVEAALKGELPPDIRPRMELLRLRLQLQKDLQAIPTRPPGRSTPDPLN